MARYAILSDIHSNLEALNVVLDQCRALGITDYILLGDVVGYNANPRECIDLVRSLNLVARIRGNHDDYAVRGNMNMFSIQGMKTIELAGLMAAGILLVSTSMRMWMVWKQQHHKK